MAHLTAMLRKEQALHLHQILKWRLYIKYSLLAGEAYGRWFVCVWGLSILHCGCFLLQTLNRIAILLCVPRSPVKLIRAPPAGHQNPGDMTGEGQMFMDISACLLFILSWPCPLFPLWHCHLCHFNENIEFITSEFDHNLSHTQPGSPTFS